MTKRFILKNFAEVCRKGKYYRLDIVRGVSFDGDYSPSMPFNTIIVMFSLYKDEYQFLEKIKAIPAKDIFKTPQVEWEALTIYQDITNQVFLKPGTVWKNGSLVWEPSEFLNISINQSERSIVGFGAERRQGTELPHVKKWFGIQLLKFPNSMVNGRSMTVLIPTTEVIRYYFSGSTYLTQQLFNGALSRFQKTRVANKLFYRYKVDDKLKKVYIWLKRNCYDFDAILIARGLADPKAMNAMSYINASLLTTKKNFKMSDGSPVKEACPRTKLPFSDETDMEVLGQWLPPKKGEKEFTTFWVRTIEKCSHALPFETLEIESVDSYKSSGTIDENNPPQPISNKENNQSHVKPVILNERESPSNFWEPEELEFYHSQFGHLQDLEIIKVKKTSEKDVETFLLKESEENLSEGSTLPGNSSKGNNIQPWQNKVTDAEPIPISDRLTFVSSAILEVLEKRQNLSAQSLPLGFTNNMLPFGLYAFEKPYGKSNNYIWNLIGNRKRKALFLELENDKGLKIYLLEIEGKGSVGFSLFLFADSHFGSIDPSEGAKDLMCDIADNSGGRVISEVLSGFKYTVSLKHVFTKNDSFSERVGRAIKGLFNEVK